MIHISIFLPADVNMKLKRVWDELMAAAEYFEKVSVEGIVIVHMMYALDSTPLDRTYVYRDIPL